ncbi:hypothetical protein [Williamsia deligens]|uniref:Lipoprotein n=1 Tax=Williamsia deligens TaxID=321325 RepID=A0ABW3GC33_9NOCA|nr:hypothetical protein [Williamsia deligens]
MRRATITPLLLLSFTLVAGCGSSDGSPSAATSTVTVSADAGSADRTSGSTFDVNTGISGIRNPPFTGADCAYYDGTLRNGDPVIIRGSDGSVLAKTELISMPENTGEAAGPYCGFRFSASNVKADEPAYSLTVGGFAPVVVTQAELVSREFFSARSPIDVLAENGKVPLSK